MTSGVCRGQSFKASGSAGAVCHACQRRKRRDDAGAAGARVGLGGTQDGETVPAAGRWREQAADDAGVAGAREELGCPQDGETWLLLVRTKEKVPVMYSRPVGESLPRVAIFMAVSTSVVPGPVNANVASLTVVVSISWSKVTMIGVPRMTSVSRLPGSTLTTLGADTGLGLLLGDDLFFGDLAEAADLVGAGYLVVGVDGSGLLDLPFELLLFGLVLGIAKALAAALLSTYS
jgi:hypothetical protein